MTAQSVQRVTGHAILAAPDARAFPDLVGHDRMFRNAAAGREEHQDTQRQVPDENNRPAER